MEKSLRNFLAYHYGECVDYTGGMTIRICLSLSEDSVPGVNFRSTRLGLSMTDWG